MPVRPDLFTLISSLSTYTAGSSSEIDLRAEMDCILFGTATSPRKGWPIIIRHMRRNANGFRIACNCLDSMTGHCEPDCSYCSGEGYLWDEAWYIGRSEHTKSNSALAKAYMKPPPGEVRADQKMFFFRYDVPIILGDKIVEAKLDIEGNVVVPLIREAIYRPHTIDYERSDRGRIEFIAAHCTEKDAIRSDTLS
jgi:hypothetical protein